jgi:very-short-patch-repair endonuclease
MEKQLGFFSKEDFEFINNFFDFKVTIDKHDRLKLKKKLKNEFSKNTPFDCTKIKSSMIEYYDFFFNFLSSEEKNRLMRLSVSLYDVQKRWYICDHYLNLPSDILDIVAKQRIDHYKNKSEKITKAYKEGKFDTWKKNRNDPKLRKKISDGIIAAWKNQNSKYYDVKVIENRSIAATNANKKYYDRIFSDKESEEYKKFIIKNKNPERNKKISIGVKKSWENLKKSALENGEDKKKYINMISNYGVRNYIVQDRSANKLEFIFSTILNSLNVRYEFQKPIKIGEKLIIVDFLINEKFVFEIQGDFWHATNYFCEQNSITNNKILYEGLTVDQIRKKDEERFNELKKINYIPIAFEEHDIKQNTQLIKNKINETLKQETNY